MARARDLAKLMAEIKETVGKGLDLKVLVDQGAKKVFSDHVRDGLGIMP